MCILVEHPADPGPGKPSIFKQPQQLAGFKPPWFGPPASFKANSVKSCQSRPHASHVASLCSAESSACSPQTSADPTEEPSSTAKATSPPQKPKLTISVAMGHAVIGRNGNDLDSELQFRNIKSQIQNLVEDYENYSAIDPDVIRQALPAGHIHREEDQEHARGPDSNAKLVP